MDEFVDWRDEGERMNLIRRVERLEASGKIHDAAGEAVLRRFDGMSDDEMEAVLSRMGNEELNAVLAACGETPYDFSAMTDDELNSLILKGEQA